jgi:hypothetical protein
MLKPTTKQNDQTTNDGPAFEQLSVPRPNNGPESGVLSQMMMILQLQLQVSCS